MTLVLEPIGDVPEATARTARAAFPKGSVAIRLRDEVGPLYTDAAFAALFAAQGQHAIAPWRLALVSVLQYLEGLTDRQAAEAVRARIDWKYALGLDLTDPGFDYSVLCEFRARLVDQGAAEQVLEPILRLCQERGWLRARGRQRTDSTHVLAAVRGCNRLATVQETLRHALEVLAQTAPAWLHAKAPAAWYARYGERPAWPRPPDGEAAQQALAEQVGADGVALLAALAAADAPAGLADLGAVRTLRWVWLQQYYAPEPGRPAPWREAKHLPPCALLVVSPYDLDARWGAKRETHWAGAKAHLTETCDPDAPHLITQVETTAAAVPDGAVLDAIQHALVACGRAPGEHLVDAGYPDAGALVASAARGIELLGPVPKDTSWQARTPGAFTADQFAVEWATRTAACPGGKQSVATADATDRHGNQTVQFAFAAADCQPCPVRARCTRSAARGRTLTLRPEVEQQALQAARARQAAPAFQEAYAARAGIEGTISQAVRTCGLRTARYRGLPKLHLQHLLTAVALNVLRLLTWLAGPTPPAPRPSHFAALATAPAA